MMGKHMLFRQNDASSDDFVSILTVIHMFVNVWFFQLWQKELPFHGVSQKASIIREPNNLYTDIRLFQSNVHWKEDNHFALALGFFQPSKWGLW